MSHFLSLDSVKVGLESKDKEGVFRELLEPLVRAGKIGDREEALLALLHRESQQSTGIGGGIAIPHGHIHYLPRAVASLGVALDGIDYDAMDGRPVFVVFLLLAGTQSPGQMVHGLSHFAALFSHPSLLDQVRQARSPKHVMTIIRAAEGVLR